MYDHPVKERGDELNKGLPTERNVDQRRGKLESMAGLPLLSCIASPSDVPSFPGRPTPNSEFYNPTLSSSILEQKHLVDSDVF